LENVSRELEEMVNKAINVGIPRWNIIVDPGIGFAKAADHNIELYRTILSSPSSPHFNQFPTMWGPSRKAFLGRLTDQPDPLQRQWATAAAVTAAVIAGADIVRVHDVEEMCQVVKVADALSRTLVSPRYFY